MRYVKLDNSWWRESRRWSVHRDGSAEPQLVATSRTRVTGLGEAQTVPSAPSRTGDGETILCSESVSIDLRGNATTNRTFRNRAGQQIRAVDAAGVTTSAYDQFGANTNETVVGVAGTNTIERFYDS